MKNNLSIRSIFVIATLAVVLLSAAACTEGPGGRESNSGRNAKDIDTYKTYTRDKLPDSLIARVTSIRDRAIVEKDYETLGISSLILAVRSARSHDYQGGIAEIESYIEQVESATADRNVLYTAYYRAGEFYYVTGLPNIALEYFLDAADHAATEDEKCRIYYAIGISSENTHNTSVSTDTNRYFLIAEDIAKEINDSVMVAQALFGRAGTYLDFLGVHKMKNEPLDRARADSIYTAVALLKEAEEWNGERRMDVLDFALGLSYAALKDFEKAQNHINSVDGIEYSAMGSNVAASMLICMGRYADAVTAVQRAYDIGESTSNEGDMRNSLHILYYAYKYTGDAKKALDALEKYDVKWQRSTDELFERQVNVARIRFDTKLKEEQLAAAEKENSLYRRGLLIIGCAFLIVATLLAVIVFYYRKIREAHRSLAQKSVQWAQEPVVPPSAANSRKEDERRALVKRLDEVMSDEKLYLRSDLTIGEVASALEINRTYLSDAINRTYGSSFTSYINDLRVRDAVKLISDPASDQYTVDAWAKMTGFSNRKTFHSAFVRATGLTPSEFRRSRRNI